MAALGLLTTYIGLRGTDSKVITDAKKGLSATGVYEIDTNKANGNLGTKTANVTGLAGTPVKITGNNEVVDISNPPSAPSVAINSNLINYIVKNKILGRVAEGDGGYVDSDVTVESGLIVVTQTPITYKRIFFCFGRGVFNEASQNVQTNTDTAETREDDNLTFTSLNCPEFNGKPYKIYYEEDESFDAQKMFDATFPGQTFCTSKDLDGSEGRIAPGTEAGNGGTTTDTGDGTTGPKA